MSFRVSSRLLIDVVIWIPSWRECVRRWEIAQTKRQPLVDLFTCVLVERCAARGGVLDSGQHGAQCSTLEGRAAPEGDPRPFQATHRA
jgi:hypothetical protein